MTDAELLAGIRRGGEEALAELYRRRQAGVYRFALHMSGSEAIAEDVTQEVFLMLVRDPKRFDPARGGVEAFLLGVARNLVLHRIRRERGARPLEDDMPADGDPAGEAVQRSDVQTLRRAILALPPRYREAVVLCALEEKSYAEAAKLAGCAEGTIRSRLHRARALLARKLRQGARLGRCLA